MRKKKSDDIQIVYFLFIYIFKEFKTKKLVISHKSNFAWSKLFSGMMLSNY